MYSGSDCEVMSPPNPASFCNGRGVISARVCPRELTSGWDDKRHDGTERMNKLLPFALLLPAALLLGFYLASLYGYSLPYGTQGGTIVAAVFWILLFFIVYGHLNGWQSARVFLVIFVVLKFSSIAYRRMTAESSFGSTLFELAGASILAWFLFTLFWPSKTRRNLRMNRPSNE